VADSSTLVFGFHSGQSESTSSLGEEPPIEAGPVCCSATRQAVGPPAPGLDDPGRQW
jgi:hypothetical protein